MFINEQVIMFWDTRQVSEVFDFAETLCNSKLRGTKPDTNWSDYLNNSSDLFYSFCGA